jgi:Rps23 Pro-64 3,4-dihydroxylase Tpa1-like proline 4-hydroxylase
MDGTSQPLRLNAGLDLETLAAQFARDQRIQIRDVLDQESAVAITRLLIEQTPWGVTWQAGEDGPHRVRSEEMAQFAQRDVPQVSAKLHRAMAGEDFAFIYSHYRMSKALEEGWSRTPGHDAIVLGLNEPSFLDFIRQVTGVPQIAVCDAQASHYGPNQFLSLHQDVSVDPNEDRLVAYVLNLCPDRWRPDWGGYLNFFNDDGDVVAGYMPRFNCLNMFRVPQNHSVSYVPPFAAGNRLAITGWFRSR